MIAFNSVWRERLFWSDIMSKPKNITQFGFVYLEIDPVKAIHHSTHKKLFGCPRARVIYHWEFSCSGTLKTYGDEYKQRVEQSSGMMFFPMTVWMGKNKDSWMSVLFNVCHYHKWLTVLLCEPDTKGLCLMNLTKDCYKVNDDNYLTWYQIEKKAKAG
jgi:hypothetical protein